MKYLFLIVYCSCAALTFALRPGHTEDCIDLLADMIDSERKCINSDPLQNMNTTSSNNTISSNIEDTSASDESDPNQDINDQNSETNSDANNAPDANSDQADDIDPATNNPATTDLTANPSQSSKSPSKQNANTIIVDNNQDFLNAIQQLKAGDRLLVRNGTYQAPVGQEITITAKGTANNWVIIAAYPGDKPILKGTHWATLRVSGAAYVEIKGFEVIGADPSQNSGGNGIAIGDRSHHIRIINNTAHAIPGGAIEVSHSDYLHIEGNTIILLGAGFRTIQNTAMGIAPLAFINSRMPIAAVPESVILSGATGFITFLIPSRFSMATAFPMATALFWMTHNIHNPGVRLSKQGF
jgi:hypothetical protein